MGLAEGMRRRAASVLGAYGRAVVVVAETIAGDRTSDDPGPQPAAPPRPLPPPPVDAAQADLRTLRAAALDSTLAAAADPGRSAADRFATRVSGVSDWTAGRLLADTERLRLAAVEIARSTAGPDGPAPRRVFAAALRRQFPWADEPTVHALWDHAVLIGHRTAPAPEPQPEAERGVLSGLIGRLRRNG